MYCFMIFFNEILVSLCFMISYAPRTFLGEFDCVERKEFQEN